MIPAELSGHLSWSSLAATGASFQEAGVKMARLPIIKTREPHSLYHIVLFRQVIENSLNARGGKLDSISQWEGHKKKTVAIFNLPYLRS